MNEALTGKIAAAISRFTKWLDGYGELSYDHQSFYAGQLGRSAKALYYRRPLIGTVAVAPMVVCEAFLPSARKLFWKPQRFPIADAHYAMGFALMVGAPNDIRQYERAVHFLEVLRETRCPDYDDYCWGYPFNWETRNGTFKEGTPLITTVPYVYEAFSDVYAIDGDPAWLRVMRSIAEHAFARYREIETAPGCASCAYRPTPDDPCGVINASAYRAYLLTRAGIELSEPRYVEAAKRNLNFVLAAQNANGSWYYSIDTVRDFVDHFHTCFVLKALTKIEQLTGWIECRAAIEHGVEYYVKNLFDDQKLPIPFSKAPRMTVYRRELYDYAECINLAALLHGRFADLDNILNVVVNDLLARWQKRDGSFRARELMVGWDNVPMHRWAQSQVFRSLALLLFRQSNAVDPHLLHEPLQVSRN